MFDSYAKHIIDSILEKHSVNKGMFLQPANILLFQGLSENSLQTLLTHAIIRDFAAGKEILQQGECAKYLCCIINGAVKTVRYNTEGEETTIRLLSAFETFMDAVIFMGGTSPISVKAMTDCTILMISADAVRHHALHDSRLANNLLKIVSRHYRGAIKQIDSIVSQSPTSRVGYYLLKQHIEQGIHSNEISLPFQKSTIASYLGMKPETFSRSLQALKKNGVNTDQQKITLDAPYALCRFCDPDTAADCSQFKSSECPLLNEGKSYH